MFDEQDYHMMYGIRRSPDITLEVPMALYPHFLEGLMSGRHVGVDTPVGVMDCCVLRVAPAANLISGAKHFCDVTLRPTGAAKARNSVASKIEQYCGDSAKFKDFKDFMFVFDPKLSDITKRFIDQLDDQPPKKEKPVKIRNKFYVAAPSVTTHHEQDQDNIDPAQLDTAPQRSGGGKWTRKDLKSAIDHATAMLEKNPVLEHVAISKIVTIVRRKKAPVVVEHVK